MFSVTQCFKYGFNFIYFPKLNVGEGKYSCYMLTDQKNPNNKPEKDSVYYWKPVF